MAWLLGLVERCTGPAAYHGYGETLVQKALISSDVKNRSGRGPPARS